MSVLRQNIADGDIDVLHEETLITPPPETRSDADGFVYLQLLWSERRRLWKSVVWGLVIGVVVALLLPKHYESTVSIMPPDSLDNSGMMMALASKASPELAGMASGLLGMKNNGALYVGLLRSRTVEDHIVDKFDLLKIYQVKYRQDARKILAKHTAIDEDRKSGIITLTATEQNPNLARNIAQAYLDDLNSLVSEVSTSSARRERVFIEQRLSAVKSDLEDAEQQFSAFASKNSALDIKEQTRAMVESAATLEGQLIAARSELEGLRQIYSVNNVRVRSAQARVDELDRQLQKIGGTDASLAGDTSRAGDSYPSIRKLPLLGVQWSDLYRRVKIQETVYELLSQQYEMARIQEAKEVPTVNVIDAANLPEKKSWPPRLLVMALCTLLLLAVTAAVIIGQERIKSLEADDPYRIMAEYAGRAWRQLQLSGRSYFGRFRLSRKPQGPLL